MRSDNFKKIVIFMSIEILLVAFIGGILFLINAENSGNEVMVMSIIFMWLPALAVFITRKITYDKSPLLLKPKFKKNWRVYLASAYIPSIMIILGAVLYFIVFPSHLDLTLGYVKNLADAYGQQVSLPTLSIPVLILIAIGLALFAPFVFINHILAFGEEIGWRAYLLPLLCQEIGTVKGIVLDGILWGVVHAPLVYFGVNYSGHYFGAPWTGMLMMIVFATAVGVFLSYLTIKTESVLPACISHGAINAIREAPLFIVVSDYNALLGPKPSGIIGMMGFLVLGLILLLKVGRENQTNKICF